MPSLRSCTLPLFRCNSFHTSDPCTGFFPRVFRSRRMRINLVTRPTFCYSNVRSKGSHKYAIGHSSAQRILMCAHVVQRERTAIELLSGTLLHGPGLLQGLARSLSCALFTHYLLPLLRDSRVFQGERERLQEGYTTVLSHRLWSVLLRIFSWRPCATRLWDSANVSG